MRLHNIPPIGAGGTRARGTEAQAGLTAEALTAQLCAFRADTVNMGTEVKAMRQMMEPQFQRMIALLEQVVVLLTDSNACVESNAGKLDGLTTKTDALLDRGQELLDKGEEMKQRGDEVVAQTRRVENEVRRRAEQIERTEAGPTDV